jgi:hypothetical protein
VYTALAEGPDVKMSMALAYMFGDDCSVANEIHLGCAFVRLIEECECGMWESGWVEVRKERRKYVSSAC